MGRKAVVFSPATKVATLEFVRDTGKLPTTHAPGTVMKNMNPNWLRKVTEKSTGRGRPRVRLVLSAEARSYMKKTIGRLNK